jgi:uncharacterized protein (DUF952 family)
MAWNPDEIAVAANAAVRDYPRETRVAQPTETTIYKIAPRTLWDKAEAEGRFSGAPVDHADGFIHFSTAMQVAETAARHFKGTDDLVLVAVDTAALGDQLRYEPSRGGQLFPHLYGVLALDAVQWVRPLPLGPDGAHQFPELA